MNAAGSEGKLAKELNYLKDYRADSFFEVGDEIWRI